MLQPRKVNLAHKRNRTIAVPVPTLPVSAFYKRGCQEKYFARDWRERRNSSLASSPCVGVRIRDFPISADSSRWRDDVIRLLTRTSSVVVRCQPWFYLRLEAYSFFWLSEGAYSLSRDSRCSEHTLRLTRLWRLTLEPKRQKN